jgi:hypothetical protein
VGEEEEEEDVYSVLKWISFLPYFATRLVVFLLTSATLLRGAYINSPTVNPSYQTPQHIKFSTSKNAERASAMSFLSLLFKTPKKIIISFLSPFQKRLIQPPHGLFPRLASKNTEANVMSSSAPARRSKPHLA